MHPVKYGIRPYVSYFLTGIISFLIVAPAFGSDMGHFKFGKLLGAYVKEGAVDYRGFKQNESELDDYLTLLGDTDIKTLRHEEQYAFYINAYNAGTIKLILGKYPDITSIWDLGNRVFNSPFKKKFIRLGGEIVSLDHIEHTILRPRFSDPRVHFAVNCASKSCPPLSPQPYLGETLDKQLNDATRAFINNTRFNRLEGNTLYISRIFKWFSSDFDKDPIRFFLKFATGDLKEKLEMQKKDIRIKYLKYDWSLNKQ